MKRKIYLHVFLLTLAEALLFSVNSPFIEKLIGSELVGTVYSLGSLATLLLLLYLPRVLERVRAGDALSVLLLAGALGATGVAFAGNPWIFGFLIIFLAIPQVTPAVSDIYIEKVSLIRDRGKTIGSEFTWMNLAFTISPIIAGFIIARSGFNTLYIISTLVFILALFASRTFTKISTPHIRKGNLWRGLKSAWTNNDLRHVLILCFLLQFFFSWMVIYTPLYLIASFGLSFESLGIIFSIMLLPYLLLEYPLGRLADGKLGEKELLGCGFVLMAITVGIIPLIHTGSLIIWTIILFGTRIGAAMVESMSATYFYKKVRSDDADSPALFRDMRPLAYLVAPLMASFVINKFGTSTLFPILGIIMLLGAFISTRLHDTR